MYGESHSAVRTGVERKFAFLVMQVTNLVYMSSTEYVMGSVYRKQYPDDVETVDKDIDYLILFATVDKKSNKIYQW